MKGIKLAIISLASCKLCCKRSCPAVADLNDRLTSLKGVTQSINEELSSQRAVIGQLKAEVKAANDENARLRRQLLNELKSVQRQNQAIIDLLSPVRHLKKTRMR